jgi:hypothetical protein
MANKLKLEAQVTFSGIDELSGKLSAIGQGIMDFGNRAQEVGEKLGGLGERMVGFGEKIGLTAALASEGAEKLHEWSEAVSEPTEAMQKNMAGMAAMTRLGGDALENIKRHAVDFAAVHPGVIADDWVAGFTRMRAIFQDTAHAMRAEDVSAMLTRLGVDSDAATRLIATGWSNLGVDAVKTGDQFTRTIQVFGLAPEQTNQFAMAVGRLGASAAAAHAPFSEVLALGGEVQQLLGGGRGATTFASLIRDLETAAAKGKATKDFSHGLIAALQQLRSQLHGTSVDKIAAFSEMGLSTQAPQLLKLLDNLDQVAAKQKQISASRGALAKAYGTATDNMADATARLHQNYENFADALTNPALGIQARLTNYFSDSIASLTTHLEHHSVVAGAATLAVTGLGSAAYHGVQALSALGTMSIFAGQGLQLAQWAMKALDFQGLALRGMYAWESIGKVADAVKGLGGTLLGALPLISSLGSTLAGAGAAISSFGAMLLANPITWYVAGALAAAAYEIYEHWGEIAGFFEHLWSRIKTLFSEGIDWLKNTGINMMKRLGEGILAGVEYPFKAAWQVAEKVGGLFHFHSPPDYGPLRDAVLNFRFGEELAARIQPAPVVGAASKMAAGIATPVVRAEPTGQASAGRAGADNTIHIHYSPHINVTGGPSAKDEWVKAARQHADELVRIIRGKLQREARLSFT